MRVYTKYQTLPARKAAAASHFQWLLASMLVAFLIWVWWKNLQQPGRTSTLEQNGRISVTPVFRATREGGSNPAVSIVMTRPVVPSSSQEAPLGPHVPRNAYEMQVALARHGISSGSLDGIMGSQTRAALRAFQQKEGLPVTGRADSETKTRLLLNNPPERNYIVSVEDLRRLSPVGTTWLAKSLQDRLEYESVLELISEKGHAHPNLIRMLNPTVDWNKVQPGTVIKLPDVEYAPPRIKAASVRIRLSDKTLQAFDSGTNILAHFPCSIARQVEKRPLGRMTVETIAFHPNYRFSPEIFPESEEGRQLKRPLMIPQGPNNPVGTAWIGLSRPGYGIHGTPRPEDVGRTESHGCFRLANWNAEYLARLVEIGTPVTVEP